MAGMGVTAYPEPDAGLALALSPAQATSVREATDTRLALWTGPAHCGRALTAAAAFTAAVLAGPLDQRAVIVGPTLHGITEDVLEPLDAHGRLVRHARSANLATFLGRTVLLRSARALREENGGLAQLRGLGGGAGALVLLHLPDEMPEELFKTFRRMPDVRVFADASPEQGDHWLWQRYAARVDELPGVRWWHFTLHDSALDPRYIEALAANCTTPELYRRWVTGLPDGAPEPRRWD